MAMESLGGRMPAGQPVAVSSGNRSHVFAIDAGGGMSHWMSTNGGTWIGPTPLPGANLVASIPCAIALPDGSVHVFAIVNGGPLAHWRSTDGVIWAQRNDGQLIIPGGWNGLAAASPDGVNLAVFAMTRNGIMQYTFAGGQGIPVVTGPLVSSAGFPVRILSAVSAAPGTIDVFAVDPNIRMPLHWHFNGAWTRQLIGGSAHSDSGLVAVVTRPGQIELVGITPNGLITSWSVSGSVFTPRAIPSGQWALATGVPGALASGGKVDLFAIAQGGPLLQWRFDGTWSVPVVHEGNLAAGGVAVVLGTAGSGLQVFGFNAGLNNSLLLWPGGIAAYSPDQWRNWAGNRQTPLQGHCYPTCLEELVAIVRSAAQQDKRVRAVGSGWSFSGAAVTTGYLVETNKVNRVLDTVLPKAFNPRRGDATIDHLVHVESGIKVEDLMRFLDSKMLAPFTMGGASGQTLAGVISTCVHGSDFDRGPIPDKVRAIHLVGPDGMQHWIEPKDQPITSKQALQDALGPDVTIHYDDDWFDTALVSVGALGIVYSVVLEVTDQYDLSQASIQLKWMDTPAGLAGARTMLATASTFINPDGRRSVDLAIDPGETGDRTCWLRTRIEKHPPANMPFGKPAVDPLAIYCELNFLEILFAGATTFGLAVAVYGMIVALVPPLALLGPTLAVLVTTGAFLSTLVAALRAIGDGALSDFVGSVLNLDAGFAAWFVSNVTRGQLSSGPDLAHPIGQDIAHNMMGPANPGQCAAKALGLEMAFDATGAAHLNFLDAALMLLDNERNTNGRVLGGWISVRFVGKSRAVLSPQQTARTCMVEVVSLRSMTSTKPLFDALETLGTSMGGIPHWGMFYFPNKKNVMRDYPRLNTFRRVRWELTNVGTVHTFDSQFTIDTGLSDPPETIRIESINFNPPGSDVQGEFVVIENQTTAAVALTNWTLKDSANHRFKFPLFVLQGAATVKVWTKSGADDANNLFWGRQAAVWNNTGDTATLSDQTGTVISSFTY
jgi:hypothetical protein